MNGIGGTFITPPAGSDRWPIHIKLFNATIFDRHTDSANLGGKSILMTFYGPADGSASSDSASTGKGLYISGYVILGITLLVGVCGAFSGKLFQEDGAPTWQSPWNKNGV